MSQQPNIQIESKKNIEDSDLPVPRSQGKDTLPNSLSLQMKKFSQFLVQIAVML